MDDFQTYLKNHPAKRRITGLVTLTPRIAPLRGSDDAACELLKRPLIEWLLHNQGKIHHRMPGKMQMLLHGPLDEFWQKLLAKEFPSFTITFAKPPEEKNSPP